MKPRWTGRWHLVESDLWGDDSIDLLGQAHIEFGPDRLGYLMVGALQADVDYRIADRDGLSMVEFSWIGDDDGHPASGRGSARLQSDGTLRIQLHIHRGDEAVMTGVPTARSPTTSSPNTSPRRGAGRRRR
ncbi:MAG TPA: hypothetical protein VK698_38725 [Kofleriaceae bacterium]|nr:hypothetical protein [Kofleriaceae bacterium]